MVFLTLGKVEVSVSKFCGGPYACSLSYFEPQTSECVIIKLATLISQFQQLSHFLEFFP